MVPSARYGARVQSVEIPLLDGQTLIGRSEDCEIVLKDGLASRRHARILVEGDAIRVQDLGSANGVFVNQKKVDDSAQLVPGDVLFVGTTEVLLFEYVDSDEDRLTDSGVVPVGEGGKPPAPSRERNRTPKVGVPPASLSSMPAPVRRSAIPRTDDAPADEQTARVDALDYLGRLADKLLSMGRVEAARRMLEGRLDEILTGARSGKRLEDDLIDSVGRYAIRLGAETLESKFVNTALEIHLIACRPMKEGTLQQLAALRSRAAVGDDALLAQYIQILRGRIESLSDGERVLVERIACLVADE